MTFYWSGAQESNVYKRDAFVTSWRFHNLAWQPQRHDRLTETSGTLWIHGGDLTNQRCSLATGCGIKFRLCSANPKPGYWSNLPCDWPSTAWAYSEQETENGPWSSSQTWLSARFAGLYDVPGHTNGGEDKQWFWGIVVPFSWAPQTVDPKFLRRNLLGHDSLVLMVTGVPRGGTTKV